jgi:outer membrane protein OmpA-like peptidoglycan-associated protein
MKHHLPLLLLLLLGLGACGSPPQPPTVDESTRRPVNSAMAVELQVCRHELQNTRLLATASGRLAESTAATLEHVAARQRALAAMRGEAAAQPSIGNRVFTVRFDFASTRVVVPAEISTPLNDQARIAPLIVLRGRTDGHSDAPAESRIARERALAVRDYLVAAGVDPARIRTTYQPAGDAVADNVSASGRALNRRVEIELYQTLPVAVITPATTP